VTPAWYRQDLAGVPLDQSIYDVILDLRPLWSRGQIQGHLGAFGFSGDEVLRSTNTLSGGERARVALAMITLAKANLLVLDEPTNHLDVESIEALEDAIDEYDGTVILVSHDRAFLRELATRVWALADGKLEDFSGTFVDWEQAKKDKATARAAAERQAAESARANERAKAKRGGAPARSAPEDDRRALKKRLAAAETEAAQAEADVRRLESALADQSLYDGKADGARRAAEFKRALGAARKRYDDTLAEWTGLAEAVDR
jgi:ATP-binding cassette subfamily F protein 3